MPIQLFVFDVVTLLLVILLGLLAVYIIALRRQLKRHEVMLGRVETYLRDLVEMKRHHNSAVE